MDPIATLRTALDDTLPLAERLAAFGALVDWIDAGGFEPPTLRDPATMHALQRLAMAGELRRAHYLRECLIPQEWDAISAHRSYAARLQRKGETHYADLARDAVRQSIRTIRDAAEELAYLPAIDR